MQTKIITNPTDSDIQFAARVIQEGGLVVFPTETVYGLGANGLDERAVGRIFEAKGRPADNPLILHVASTEQINRLALEMPCHMDKLADFMPGALTLILKKTEIVPDIVTAGLDTVAVRVPRNDIAQKLISASNVPIAAPSANLSGKPSPTTAQHVIDDLYGRVDVILDGGVCEIGIESTVLDVTTQPPVLLRPGSVTKEMLEQKLSGVVLCASDMLDSDDVPKAPGMKYRHYAPKAPMYIADDVERAALQYCADGAHGGKIGVLSALKRVELPDNCVVMHMGDTARDCAANLFACLRELDKTDVRLIVAPSLVGSGIAEAVRNRLRKAAD